MLYVNIGDVYQGDFENDDFHGQGKYSFSNGDVYVGKLNYVYHWFSNPVFYVSNMKAKLR